MKLPYNLTTCTIPSLNYSLLSPLKLTFDGNNNRMTLVKDKILDTSARYVRKHVSLKRIEIKTTKTMDKQNHTVTTLSPVSEGHEYSSAVISTAPPDPHIIYTANNQRNGSIIPHKYIINDYDKCKQKTSMPIAQKNPPITQGNYTIKNVTIITNNTITNTNDGDTTPIIYPTGSSDTPLHKPAHNLTATLISDTRRQTQHILTSTLYQDNANIPVNDIEQEPD